MLEIHADSRPNRVYTVFGKSTINGFTFDPLTDVAKPVSREPERHTIECKSAGTYAVGVTVKDSVPSLGRLDSLSVVRKIGDTYHIVPVAKQKTAELVVANNGWAVFHVNLTQLATPWFDVDLGSTSKLDRVKLFYSTGDVTRDVNRTEVALDATLDGMARDLDAGVYQFGFTVTTTVAGDVARFRVGFDLNNEASDALDFPLLECPSERCDDPQVQSCRACAQGSCSWCPESRVCSNVETGCAAAFVNDVKVCPNVQEQCASHDCQRCTDDRDCVWCERAALAGGSFCSAGKNDLGVECPDGITNPTEVAVASQCPDVVKETFEAADRLCAQKASCTACAQDPSCTYCEAKVGNDRCTASKTCDSSIFAKVVNDTAQCPDVKACSAFTKCITCAADSNCGWCGASNSCLPKVNECRAGPGADAVELFTNGTLCPRTCIGDECNCANYAICTNCTLQAHCIFCLGLDGNGTCLDGNGSLVCPSLLQRSKTQCESCPSYPDPFCPRNDAALSPMPLVALAIALLAAALH